MKRDTLSNTMPLNVTCKSCRKDVELRVPFDQWTEWQTGKFVQDAFPHLTAGEREMLISGLCEKCFDKLFNDE
jgi:hypothetical protein